MAHDEFSPSRRHRFGACPGSIREEAKYPEGPSGPAAVDGTHTHTLLECCVRKDLASPLEWVGQTLTDHEGEFVVDIERANRVAIAINYLRQRVSWITEGKRFGEYDDVDAEDNWNNFYEVRSEIRVNPKALIGIHGASGTIDVLLLDKRSNTIEIIDYKDGVQPTNAIEQLEQYAVGVLAELGSHYFDFVKLTVIQPKLIWKNLDAVSFELLSVKDVLNNVVPKLKSELELAASPDAPLVPGEKQCKYCRAKGACPALAAKVMSEVNVMFQPVNTSAMDIAQQSANKDPVTMDDDQLRQILEAAPLLRQLIEGVEKEAQRRLEAGQSVPGFKLVHGRGQRAWAYSEDEMEEKLIKMGIPKPQLYIKKFVSPAQAEKITWEKRDGTRCSLTKRQLERMEQEYVTKMAGKLTIAPDSDNRPAVIMNAASLFDAVPEAPAALPDWLK